MITIKQHYLSWADWRNSTRSAYIKARKRLGYYARIGDTNYDRSLWGQYPYADIVLEGTGCI